MMSTQLPTHAEHLPSPHPLPPHPFPLVWSELLPKPFVPPFVHSVLRVSSSLSLHLMTLTRTIYAFFSPSSLIFSLDCCLCSWDPKFSNLKGRKYAEIQVPGSTPPWCMLKLLSLILSLQDRIFSWSLLNAK